MTERKEKSNHRRGFVQRGLIKLIERQIAKENDPYREARHILTEYLGDDYLPSSAKFGALKKKLRTEQAVEVHRKIFGVNSAITREMVAGNFYNLLDTVISSDEAFDAFTRHPRNSLALIRAAITIDGGDAEIQKAENIFQAYRQAARGTVSLSDNEQTNNVRIHEVATMVFARDMRPFLRKDWRQSFTNPKS